MKGFGRKKNSDTYSLRNNKNKHFEMQENPNYEEDQENNIPDKSANDVIIEVTSTRNCELMITKTLPVQKPDIADEVRASADAEMLSNNAVLLLQTNETRTDHVVKSLLSKMLLSASDREIYINMLDKEIENGTGFGRVEAVFEALTVSNKDSSDGLVQFVKTMHGLELNVDDDVLQQDPSWLIVMAAGAPGVQERMVGIVTTRHPINMGSGPRSIRTLVVVLTPSPGMDKATKNDTETARNISVLMSEPEFRTDLLNIDTEENCRRLISKTTEKLVNAALTSKESSNCEKNSEEGCEGEEPGKTAFGFGIYRDLKRRFQSLGSDYTDGFCDKSGFIKLLSTIFFLFFANLLPTIAFGMLNEGNTDQKITIARGLIAQLIGGVGFAIFGGQYLTIMLTTAPLAIIILVLYTISASLNYPFYAFYAYVGIFNTIYLCIYAFSGLSKIMKFSTRSTEETFAIFISIAFIVDSMKAVVKSFNYYYYGGKCIDSAIAVCQKEESLLFLILMLGTVALALWLNKFANTPFLNPTCRRLIADFALPVAVLFMSFMGSYVFKDVHMHSFNAPHWSNFTVSIANLGSMPWQGVLTAAGIALPLSILFFMDQNISSSIVNSPANKLKKGAAYHWDLVVVGIINLVLSLLGLPFVHGALPHSPMHVRALATVEEHVDQNNHVTTRVVSVIESRIPSILANVLVGACLFLMPHPLIWIPAAVLYGLFLFMALTGVEDNQLLQRILLLITEQTAYPPTHFLRRVPQARVHLFTFCQVIQLGALCALGFTPIPYVKLVFPFLLLIQLPIRHFLLPKIIPRRYMEVMDKAI